MMPFIAIFKSVKELQSLSFLVFCYTLNKVLNELRKWYCIQNVYFYQFDRFVNDAIYSDFQKCQGVAVFEFLGFLLYIEQGLEWTTKMILYSKCIQMLHSRKKQIENYHIQDPVKIISRILKVFQEVLLGPCHHSETRNDRKTYNSSDIKHVSVSG